jgi:hypothetical protein
MQVLDEFFNLQIKRQIDHMITLGEMDTLHDLVNELEAYTRKMKRVQQLHVDEDIGDLSPQPTIRYTLRC